MDDLLGVSDPFLLALLLGYVCGCSGRGSLVDALVRRRPEGLRTGGDG